MHWAPIIRPDAASRHERTFAALNGAAVLLFAVLVLVSGAVPLQSYAKLASAYIGVTLMIFFFAAVLFAGQVVLRTGVASRWKESPSRAVASAFRDKWRDERLFCLFWPVALFLLLMLIFNAFKQRILPAAGFVHDATLAEMDRLIFGTDPGIWLHQTIGSPAMTRFLDAIYHSWFVPTTLGLCVVGLCASVRTRAQYITAYVGIWILLGAVAAYLMPAAGPAFYEQLADPMGAGPFIAVQQQLTQAGDAGTFLTSLYNQDYLIRSLGEPELVVGGGISAIPSVHNAMAVLFALASFRAHYLLGLAMSGFALLIWVGSVYLNWHYAVDGMIGAAGAAALWYGAGWLVDHVSERGGATEAAPKIVSTLKT
jgi:hypothetical protein